MGEHFNVRPHEGITPTLGERVYIDPMAAVIGDVHLGDDCSVWPHTVIRGDMHRIRIGARCSIQDGSVLHITHASTYEPEGHPLTLGDDVTVGHRAVLHGCTIGNRVLIGIGAIVMDGAIIEDEVVIAAGSLVPPGKKLEGGFLYVGSPAKPARTLTEKEKSFFVYGTNNYSQLKEKHRASNAGNSIKITG
jgi:carbonic anhydrase/acetyltransferase-like protein (isoleucine patch superfamily)